MKTVIFGGAFNPVTKAHIATASEIADRLEAYIWFMPCDSHTFNKKMESFEHRYNMLSLALQINMSISTFEKENKIGGCTFDLMTALKVEYPEQDFYFLIGMDNANCLSRWKNWTNLVKEVKFIVIPRRGTIPQTTWFMSEPHIFMKDVFIDEMSSTNARNSLANGENPCMLDDKVYDYIIEHGLYKGDIK
jgi:nicotinate-nucleotide adenylyltransferase